MEANGAESHAAKTLRKEDEHNAKRNKDAQQQTRGEAEKVADENEDGVDERREED